MQLQNFQNGCNYECYSDLFTALKKCFQSILVKYKLKIFFFLMNSFYYNKMKSPSQNQVWLQSIHACVFVQTFACMYMCEHICTKPRNPYSSKCSKELRLAAEELGSPRATVLVQPYLHGTLPELINLTSFLRDLTWISPWYGPSSVATTLNVVQCSMMQQCRHPCKPQEQASS